MAPGSQVKGGALRSRRGCSGGLTAAQNGGSREDAPLHQEADRTKSHHYYLLSSIESTASGRRCSAPLSGEELKPVYPPVAPGAAGFSARLQYAFGPGVPRSLY
jgi:hypothetical protein